MVKKYWVKKSELFTQKYLDELEDVFAQTEYFGERVFPVILLSDLKKAIGKFFDEENLYVFMNRIVDLTLQEVFSDFELNIISKLKIIKGKERNWYYFDYDKYKKWKKEW